MDEIRWFLAGCIAGISVFVLGLAVLLRKLSNNDDGGPQ